jgi:hypothetical protein
MLEPDETRPHAEPAPLPSLPRRTRTLVVADDSARLAGTVTLPAALAERFAPRSRWCVRERSSGARLAVAFPAATASERELLLVPGGSPLPLKLAEDLLLDLCGALLDGTPPRTLGRLLLPPGATFLVPPAVALGFVLAARSPIPATGVAVLELRRARLDAIDRGEGVP